MPKQQTDPFPEVRAADLTRLGERAPGFAAVQAFLTRFGYLRLTAFREGEFDSSTYDALKKYQERHGLPVSGQFDNTTKIHMTRHRCAMPDLHEGVDFVTRCAWDRRRLTFAFNNGTTDVVGGAEFQAVRSAFRTWSLSVHPHFTFIEVGVGQNPDILIDWRDANDPDRSMVGGALAHADFPPGCSIITNTLPKPIHFDDSEHTWNIGAASKVFDVETTALHEIGHILGLLHTTVPDAVMVDSISDNFVRRSLQPDDLQGIESLYPPLLAQSGPSGLFANVPRVNFVGRDSHIHEIAYYPENDNWGHFDMTESTGAPLASGAPSGYVADVPRVVYRGHDGHIHEIAYYPESANWGHFDLTAATGAPSAAGDPRGYVADVPRVVYRSQDGRVHEIAYYPESANWGHFDLTAATGAPSAAGDPRGYVADVPRVVYCGQDGHVHEIAYYPESSNWGHFDLTAATGAPLAAGSPMGYVEAVPRVVYRGQDGHIHQILYYPESGNWGHFDMTAATGAPSAGGDPMGYVETVSRVVYRGQDGHIHEIAHYPESGNWGHFDMTAATGAPSAGGDPVGYVAAVPRVVYRGQNGYIHEIAYYPQSGDWGHFEMTTAI